MSILRPVVGLVLFAACWVLAAPSAVAQIDRPLVITSMSPTVVGPDRIMPDVDTGTVRIEARVESPALSFCLQDVTMHWVLRSRPGYADVSLSPESESKSFSSEPQPSIGGLHPHYLTFTTTATIRLSRSAPAYETPPYEVEAHATAATFTESANCNLSPGHSSVTFALQNDYFSRMQFVAESLRSTEPEGRFAIEVFNLGNGPTRVTAELRPLDKYAFQALSLSSQELRLESRTRGPSAHFHGTITADYVMAPDYSGAFEVRLFATYDGAAMDAASEEQTFRFSVVPEVASRTEAAYASGFDGTLLAAALGLAGTALLGRKT